MSIEENRHHDSRIKAKRKNYHSYWACSSANRKRVLGILAKTACLCSNPSCCGNPRKLYKNGKYAHTISDTRKLNSPDY